MLGSNAPSFPSKRPKFLVAGGLLTKPCDSGHSGAGRTCMGHVLVALYAPFHGCPAALEEVGAPEVPIGVREGFPVNFRVMTDI